MVVGVPPIIQGDPIHLLGGPHVGGAGTQLIGHRVDFASIGDGLFTHTIRKPEYWTSPVVPYTPLQLDLALAQSFARHYSQLGNTDGTVQGNAEAVFRLTLYATVLGTALSVGQLGKQAEAAAQLAGLQFDRDVFADTLALPGVGINLALVGKEKRDRLLIRSCARPSAWAKRRVQTGNTCELREPVR